MTTHTWLKELQARGVQFSIDGANLTIKARRGVMTPDLRERLSVQKRDLISQLELESDQAH